MLETYRISIMLAPQAPNKPRQESDDPEQSQGKQGLLDGPHPSGCCFQSRVAQVGIGNDPWRHAYERGKHVLAEANPGETEGVIHQIEWKQRHQTHNRDEAPALLLAPSDQTCQS